jgi:hypothetical protein
MGVELIEKGEIIGPAHAPAAVGSHHAPERFELPGGPDRRQHCPSAIVLVGAADRFLDDGAEHEIAGIGVGILAAGIPPEIGCEDGSQIGRMRRVAVGIARQVGVQIGSGGCIVAVLATRKTGAMSEQLADGYGQSTRIRRRPIGREEASQ